MAPGEGAERRDGNREARAWRPVETPSKRARFRRYRLAHRNPKRRTPEVEGSRRSVRRTAMAPILIAVGQFHPGLIAREAESALVGDILAALVQRGKG
jgi:hypothetical protein